MKSRTNAEHKRLVQAWENALNGEISELEAEIKAAKGIRKRRKVGFSGTGISSVKPHRAPALELALEHAQRELNWLRDAHGIEPARLPMSDTITRAEHVNYPLPYYEETDYISQTRLWSSMFGEDEAYRFYSALRGTIAIAESFRDPKWHKLMERSFVYVSNFSWLLITGLILSQVAMEAWAKYIDPHLQQRFAEENAAHRPHLAVTLRSVKTMQGYAKDRDAVRHAFERAPATIQRINGLPEGINECLVPSNLRTKTKYTKPKIDNQDWLDTPY